MMKIFKSLSGPLLNFYHEALFAEVLFMITYEDLLSESDSNHLIVKEKNLPVSKGRIKGRRIAIRKDLTETEKKCVLAEELGHYYTAVGDILDQSDVSSRKREMRGRIMAYDRLVGLTGIVSAYKHGCRSLSESAEHLGVTEAFLADAICYYRRKYGSYTTTGHYGILFEPSIAVLELM